MTTMTSRHIVRWLAAGMALAAAACGGGGSSGGIGGTGNEPSVAYGTITAFGSVWVNGVEYNTSSTNFKTDDNPGGGGNQGQLREGMVVRVDGSIATRTATTITEDQSVKGLVEQVIDANRFVVMGQIIQTDTTTRFENGVQPAVSDRVEVHGQIAGDGVISAGFVEKTTTAPTPPYAVKGIVKNHVGQSFQIGTLTVVYDTRTQVSRNMPAGSWDGLQVNVKGDACTGAAPLCGSLTATQVEPAGAIVENAQQAEIEGVVVAIAANGFTIGNQQVVTTTSTRYEGGVVGDILVGTEVEAEGPISGGVLTATKVSFRDAVRLEGDVASVTGNDLTIVGLPGVTVSRTSFTELKDFPGAGLPVVGQHVRVRGKLGSGNTLSASRLEFRSPKEDVELQAPVQEVSPEASVRLLGIVVPTGGNISVYRDLDGSSITRTAFFAAAHVNGLIKAKGTLAGGSVTWTELELEN